MSKPDNFILSTDFATLKNSQSGLTAQITVPGSQSIAASDVFLVYADIPITEPYSIATARISSSKNSNKMLVGNATDFTRIGNIEGEPAIYNVFAFIWRTSSNNVRFQAIIQNPYGYTLTGAAGDEVFNLYFNTFVPPFA